MEGKKLLPTIVAILVIASVLSISTTAIATHGPPTVSISPTRARSNYSVAFTLTVKNESGNPIDNVRVILPAGFTDPNAMVKLPKDNEVQLKDNNLVELATDTLLTLWEVIWPMNVPENTAVIRENGKWIWSKDMGENARLMENARVAVMVLNRVDLENGDNLRMAKAKVEALSDNRVRLLKDTPVVLVPPDNIARLVENTKVSVVGTTVSLDVGDNVKMDKAKVENLYFDNKARLLERTLVKRRGVVEEYWTAGTEIELMVDNEVILPAGTILTLAATTTMKVPENTQVTRERDTKVFYGTVPLIRLPTGWAFSDNTWIAENVDYDIEAGTSKEFPFIVRTPVAGGTYILLVATGDAYGSRYTRYTEVSVFVDNVAPWVSIAVSKDPAKRENIVITVTANEALSRLDNVLVAENNAPENVPVTMTSADNIVWMGTYETSDNTDRDGLATVWAVGIADGVGIPGADNSKTFTIDRLPPPQLSAVYGLSALLALTNQESQLVTGWAVDNILGVVENKAGLTVKIRVGTTEYTTTSGIDNKFSKAVTLAEGPNEVGVRVVDMAGNEGAENVQSVFLDSKKPVITFVKVAGKSAADNMKVNDNTPKIELTITDPGYPTTGLGVENKPYGSSGFSVQLLRDNGDVMDNLVNALAWDKATGKFENTWPTALPPENYYKIFVIAGDNLNSDNKLLRFYIDIGAPAKPTPVDNPLAGTTLTNPAKMRTVALAVTGTAEANATINVYVNEDIVTTVPVGADGRWSANISLTPGKLNKVEVSAVDEAGNESERTLLGFAFVDITRPTLTITAPATGTKTDKPSIAVSGIVSDDVTAAEELSIEVDAPGLAGPKRVRAGPGGGFSTSVALLEGSNPITVTVTDEAGNVSTSSVVVERTVPPWGTYAIILVIVALILAAIAIFRKR